MSVGSAGNTQPSLDIFLRENGFSWMQHPPSKLNYVLPTVSSTYSTQRPGTYILPWSNDVFQAASFMLTSGFLPLLETVDLFITDENPECWQGWCTLAISQLQREPPGKHKNTRFTCATFWELNSEHIQKYIPKNITYPLPMTADITEHCNTY